jgi:hypothetical protein
VLQALGAIVEEKYEMGRQAVTALLDFPGFTDPEGWYYWATASGGLQDHDRALELLARAVDSGLHCVKALETPPQFDTIRLRPEFAEIAERARAGQVFAARAFADADGHRILGLPVA